MPYTKEDYKREVARELFLKAPPGDRREWLDQLPADERLSGLPPDKRLYGLSAARTPEWTVRGAD